MTSPQIELIVRAVITEGSRLLLAQSVGEEWYFLPGGHVEPGETASAALRRELEEELGVHDVQVGEVLAIAESHYTDMRGDHHEVNLVHRVTVQDATDRSQEEHLRFRWLEMSGLDRVEIRPAPVADLLRRGVEGSELDGWTRGPA